jgi:hypothetical protein
MFEEVKKTTKIKGMQNNFRLENTTHKFSVLIEYQAKSVQDILKFLIATQQLQEMA